MSAIRKMSCTDARNIKHFASMLKMCLKCFTTENQGVCNVSCIQNNFPIVVFDFYPFSLFSAVVFLQTKDDGRNSPQESGCEATTFPV